TYNTVSLENGTTLSLAPGNYTFCSIKTGRHVRLRVTGGSQSTINVGGNAWFGNDTTFEPDAATPTPLLNVTGDEVHISAGSEVRAFIPAPNARLTLGRGSKLIGAACARSLATGRRVTVECAPEPTSTTTTAAPTTTTAAPTTTTAAPTTTT